MAGFFHLPCTGAIIIAGFALVLSLCRVEESHANTNVPHCNTHPDALAEHGITHECFESPGLADKRCYYTLVPDCVKQATNRVPVVFDMHCYGECPSKSVSFTGWKDLAEEECFVAVWPVGTVDPDIAQHSCFNFEGGVRWRNREGRDVATNQCCCYGKDWEDVPTTATEDPTFLRNIVTRLVARDGGGTDEAVASRIDPTRIYMAGHSNGCAGALSMAASHSDIVAAVCCHSGMMITDFATDYTPVPTWLVHGRKDVNVDPAGGNPRWNHMDLETTRHYIADKHECSSKSVFRDVVDANNVVVGESFVRRDCANNATVEVVVLAEAGHIPYYMYEPPPKTTTIDTTRMAWEFCSSHAKPGIPAVFQQQEEAENRNSEL